MSLTPLAERLRPKKLSEFIGQKEIVGPDGIVNKLIKGAKKTGFFPSLIFWGPPGSGKTTLARIISNELKREFFEFSAVNTSVKELEKIMNYESRINKQKQQPISSKLAPIIFLDEIHRFNKAQQDKLLPYIESGAVILIGATTENPSFEVIGPLMSRLRVIVLPQLDEKSLQKIIKRAIQIIKRGIEKDALNFLIEASNGDARVALNVLEIAVNLTTLHNLQTEDIENALQKRQLSFDKQGDEFYNVISAFIKSMRASDVDAALYYLARMVAAGQDPLYIARRMVVFASEDVATPTALVVADAVFRACETVGYPECQENLAAGTVYLTTAKKDRSVYEAYMRALDDVKKFGNLPIPLQIRNAPTMLMKGLGYSQGYEKYTKESLLPEKIKGKKYYIK